MLHEPTEETKKAVARMARAGVTKKDMAALLDISQGAFKKHYDTVISLAIAEASTRVSEALYQKAVNGDTQCMVFWLKARAGWIEKKDNSDAGGVTVIVKDLTGITIDQDASELPRVAINPPGAQDE